MSFLDRIKGSGHDKTLGESPSLQAEPFDELAPPANPMEATVRLGHSTLSPPMPSGQRADGDDSSIISEAAPSELAAEYAEMGINPGVEESGAFTSGLPIIGLNYKEVRGDGEIDVKKLAAGEEPRLVRQRAQAWLESRGNPYLLTALDIDGRTGIDYGVYGVPETYVIDKAGVIRYKQIGPLTPEAIERKILPLIRELEK